MSIFKVKALCLLVVLSLSFALLTGCTKSKDPVSNAPSMIEMATILKEITDLAMDAGHVIDR